MAEKMSMEVSFPGGVRVDAAFDGFTVRTDQSLESGGAGSAPSPFALFLAALATCAGFYALRFCQERSLATDGLGLGLEMERDPQTRLPARIALTLRLPAGFPEKYRKAILRAADQCTVKRSLFSPPEITVALDDG